MAVHELSQFWRGKWLVPSKTGGMPKESGYGILGASANVSIETYGPKEVFIGRPFFEVYDINSYTLTKVENGDFLFSFFYYGKDDPSWDDWKGKKGDPSNRHFHMEHYIIIPASIFLNLRFDIVQLTEAQEKPKLDEVYSSGGQVLDPIRVSIPSVDQVEAFLKNSLNKLLLPLKDHSLLIVEILNKYVGKKTSLTVVNCNIPYMQKVFLFQDILTLIPNKDAINFTFCTDAYIKTNSSLFSVMMVDASQRTTSAQIDFTILDGYSDENFDQYGDLIIKILSDLGVDETARLMLLTTHNLSTDSSKDAVEELRTLYEDILAETRLDFEKDWSFDDLYRVIKKKRDYGVKKYNKQIAYLYENNMQDFKILLRDFAKEIIRNGFREKAFFTLDSMTLPDLMLILLKADLRGGLSKPELNALSKWLLENYRENMSSILSDFVKANVLSLDEKNYLVKSILKENFDLNIFIETIASLDKSVDLLSPQEYLNTKDIRENFFAAAYNSLYINSGILDTNIDENLQYIKVYAKWCHMLSVIALEHYKYNFLSSHFLEIIYQCQWKADKKSWQEILSYQDKIFNIDHYMPLQVMMILLGDLKIDGIKLSAGKYELVLDDLCRFAKIITPSQELNENFLKVYLKLDNKHQNKDLRNLLFRLVKECQLYDIGRYLLKYFLPIIKPYKDNLLAALDLLEYFENDNDSRQLLMTATLYLDLLDAHTSDLGLSQRADILYDATNRMVKYHNVPSTIYSKLAMLLGGLPVNNMNSVQFHSKYVSDLGAQERKDYLSGLPEKLQAQIDSRQYINKIDFATKDQIDNLIDILKVMFQKKVDVNDIVPIFNKLDSSHFRQGRNYWRLYIINQIVGMDILDLPAYVNSIRYVYSWQKESENEYNFANDLLNATLKSLSPQQMNSAIKKILAKERQTADLLIATLKEIDPNEKNNPKEWRQLKSSLFREIKNIGNPKKSKRAS